MTVHMGTLCLEFIVRVFIVYFTLLLSSLDYATLSSRVVIGDNELERF